MKIMLKKLTIRNRLFTAFSMVLVLTVIIAILSISSLNKANSNLNFYVSSIQKTDDAIKESQLYMNIAARYIRDLALTKDTSQFSEMKDEINTNLKEIKNQLQILKDTAVLDTQELSEYETALNSWFSLGDTIINAVENSDFDRATEIILTQCTPALNSAADMAAELSSQSDALRTKIISNNIKVTNISIILVICIAVVSLIVTVMITFIVTASISRPIREIETAMKYMAQGSFDHPVKYNGKDEIGSLADSFRSISGSISDVVHDLDYLIGEVSQGNFNVESSNQDIYVGDFSSIHTSILRMKTSLSDTLRKIKNVADQVAGGADQVANGSQVLAQGATEQAASVEELASTIDDVSRQITDMADNANNANQQVIEAQNCLNDSNQNMREMIAAMGEISSRSNDISKIIKTIEDIAFQTNILALNAAVEAARAGSAGKGFAVVADEVRNLASKSAEAATNTTSLIESTITAVKHGSDMANRTAESMTRAVDSTNQAVSYVSEISETAKNEAVSISEISQGVDQISSVVQTNSATAQESAAASEELSSQSQILETLIGQFSLTSSLPGAGKSSGRMGSSGPSVPQASAGSFRSNRYSLTSDLRTGNDLIDSEHKELFDAINNLLDACSSGQGRNALEKSIQFLYDYTSRHFSDEEDLQKRYGYPDYANHKRYHETYKEVIRNLGREFTEKGPTIEMVGKVNSAIAGWLTNHIKKEDMKLAEYIRRQQKK